MKRSVWKVLAVLMALAVFMTTMASAAGSDKFTDVPSDSWYKQYVDFVVDNGYMNGVSSTKFAPNDNLTRAMFATILARYDGATVDNSKATAFSDVAVNQWYTGSIAWANEKGIVNGTGSGKFSPEANITRQDLCVMVERYITYVESTTDKVHVTPGVAKTFTDEGQIASYAKSAMDKAVIHGLIFGYPDGSVRPTQNITRAECAAIISRIAWKEGDGKESHEMTIYDAKGNVQETVTVKAGDTFTMTIHLKNESKNKLGNISLKLSSEDNQIITASGSDTIYIDTIEKEGEYDVVVDLKTRGNLEQKNYSVNINYQYEDNNWNAYEESATVNVPVYQDCRASISEKRLTKNSVAVDGKTSLSFKINNTGKGSIYNVTAEITGDTISDISSYAGTIAVGESSTIDLSINAEKTGNDKIHVKVIYEDTEGKSGSITDEFDFEVTEPVVEAAVTEQPAAAGNSKTLIIAAVAAILALIIIVSIVKKIRDKKYE